MKNYQTTYTDEYGIEKTTITNDGDTLLMLLRGIEFTGTDFDSLSPPKELNVEQVKLFPLHDSCLCSCRIECNIPIPICVHGQEGTGELIVELILGNPAKNGGLDREELHIVLQYDKAEYHGVGNSGWFEDELLSIQGQLPDGVYMKACINCLYSDYSPYGHGLFGCMKCFRNLKSEYLKVKSKTDFWKVHDFNERYVQETYLCPEFERRVPGTGYRG